MPLLTTIPTEGIYQGSKMLWAELGIDAPSASWNWERVEFRFTPSAALMHTLEESWPKVVERYRNSGWRPTLRVHATLTTTLTFGDEGKAPAMDTVTSNELTVTLYRREAEQQRVEVQDVAA